MCTGLSLASQALWLLCFAVFSESIHIDKEVCLFGNHQSVGRVRERRRGMEGRLQIQYMYQIPPGIWPHDKGSSASKEGRVRSVENCKYNGAVNSCYNLILLVFQIKAYTQNVLH